MEDQNDNEPLKLSVFQGWGSSEKIDAKINIYHVQHEVPDRFTRITKLDETLKAALRFSANLVRRTAYKESTVALALSMAFMWAFVVAIVWLLVSYGEGDAQGKTC